MIITRGKEYVFVVITIEFIDNGRLGMTKYYLTESIEVFESFSRKITISANTPAKKDLFEKDNENTSSILNEDKVNTFHHIVSKLLYVSKRTRLDTELGMPYLCTQVSCSTDGD